MSITYKINSLKKSLLVTSLKLDINMNVTEVAAAVLLNHL